jgi:small subunit ribosomal protein S17e
VGRIKTKKIKRKTKEVFAQHQDKIATNFDENKNILKEKYTIPSKKMRNVIAGYCTRLKKSED